MFYGKNLLNTFLSLLFLKINPNEEMVENLFQCEDLAAHYKFYLICKNESSWVNDWSIESDKIALVWAIEFLG